jgi:hypothetical protein
VLGEEQVTACSGARARRREAGLGHWRCTGWRRGKRNQPGAIDFEGGRGGPTCHRDRVSTREN